jgi:hypothetical protein
MHVRIEFANLVEKLIIRVLQVSGVRSVCGASNGCHSLCLHDPHYLL